MARLFAIGDNEYLKIDSAPLTAVPISMACWFRSDNITIAQVIMGLFDNSLGNVYFSLELDGAVGGDPVSAAARSATRNAASTSSGFSANTWHHGCAVFAANDDRRAYIDGGSKGTELTSRTPANIDVFALSQLYNATGGYGISGEMAEAALWNVALADAEAAMLGAGYSPLFVRPQNLVAYWSLIRGLNDRIGGYNLTAVSGDSGPIVSAHPRIIYPKPQSILWKAAAAPSGIAVLRRRRAS